MHHDHCQTFGVAVAAAVVIDLGNAAIRKFCFDQVVVAVAAVVVEASLNKTVHVVPSFVDEVTGFDVHDID